MPWAARPNSGQTARSPQRGKRESPRGRTGGTSGKVFVVSNLTESSEGVGEGGDGGRAGSVSKETTFMEPPPRLQIAVPSCYISLWSGFGKFSEIENRQYSDCWATKAVSQAKSPASLPPGGSQQGGGEGGERGGETRRFS